MKNTLSIFVALLLLSATLTAQETTEEKKGFKYNNNFNLSLSAASGQYSGALSWVKFHNVTKNKRFKMGYGVRFAAQAGNDLYYITAPAKFTSNEKNVDTFFVSTAQNNSLNLSINLQYTIKSKYDIGFNIDAVGLTFGGSTTGKYIAYQSADNGTQQTASPTSFNLLLVGDNDIGMLSSELYVRYWFNPKWGVKVGGNFIFTEYTTDKKLRLENNRWRNKSLMGLIGISYSPFR